MKKGYLPMHLFSFLNEITILNNKALYLEYPDGYTSFDILFEGSKKLPRKRKKLIRKLLKSN